MRDAFGNEVNEGDTVMIILANNMLVAKIAGMQHGGLIQRIGNKTGETPDSVELVFTLKMQFADARSGERHTTMFRTINPEKETVIRNNDAN